MQHNTLFDMLFFQSVNRRNTKLTAYKFVPYFILVLVVVVLSSQASMASPSSIEPSSPMMVTDPLPTLSIATTQNAYNVSVTLPTTIAIPQHWQLDLGKTNIGFKFADDKQGIFSEVVSNVHVDRYDPNNSRAIIGINTAQGVIELIDTLGVDDEDFYDQRFSNFGADWSFINAHTKVSHIFDALWQNGADLDSVLSTQMVFDATDFDVAHDQKAIVTGTLTLNEHSYPFTFMVNLAPIRISPQTDEPVINFIATGKIATHKVPDIQQNCVLKPKTWDATDAIVKDLTLVINGQLSYVKLY